jgi:tripartite-type tricarboxylate transporter receptor subunit TctC
MVGMRTAFVLTVALLTANAWAAYPDKPIKIIVPFAAGSGTDVVARATGAALAKRMSVQVTVENMVGADGAVGTAAVAKAAPDGYTLLATSNRLTIAPHLVQKPSYDPVKDFVPVARIAVIPLVLVTSEKSRFKSFDELVAAMRQEPGKIRYASSGRGELSHLEVALMNQHFKVQAQQQPYKSGREALAATASGQADFFLANFPMAAAQINKGALRALAVTSAARMPNAPNVPTLAEGMKQPGYEAIVWFGLLAPGGTTSQVLTRLENELEYELEVPAVQARIESVGGRVAFLRSAPFGGRIKLDYGRWGFIKSQL